MIIQIPTIKNANVAQKHLKAPFSQNCVFFSLLVPALECSSLTV